MTSQEHLAALRDRVREALYGNEDIVFAYLYGSRMLDPELPGADLDVAVYLEPADVRQYVKRDKELTAMLVCRLHTDAVDLRIINVVPLVFQYRILKEGTLLFSRDERQRSEFEAGVMTRFFELKPYLDEYREMLGQRIRGAR
jgi:predicted nucleotidyltransferase